MSHRARLILLAVLLSPPALADRILQVEFVPTEGLQIAVWIEDPSGNVVDTIMVTRLTGTFGLGNRPGRWDQKSGYLWPYGRRTGVLPVWAHRRNQEYPLLVFQDCKENGLGFHELVSSIEPYYCRPMRPDEMDVDVITCPTPLFSSDKGIPRALIAPINADCTTVMTSLPETSLYPPRNDIVELNIRDWDGVLMLAGMNDIDAVSRATPAAELPVKLLMEIGEDLPDGTYVVWIEASKEFDHNDTYTEALNPGFTDPQLPAYGLPYVGQPSVLWRVPIDIGTKTVAAKALDYVGYGSIDGTDGEVRPPDATITEGVPGTGAGRLLAIDPTWRVLASLKTEAVCFPPETPMDLRVEETGFDDEREIYAKFSFLEPADDDGDAVFSYEVRYRVGDPMANEKSFMTGVPALAPEPDVPGRRRDFSLTHLEPNTEYQVSIRAIDECLMPSALASSAAITTDRPFTKTPACFVATAAWGSPLAAEVGALRRFRDERLIRSELGRLLVAVYQATSPPLAAALRENAPLRESVRRALDPVARAALALP